MIVQDANTTSKQAHARSRGLILTKSALQLFDQELRRWWENSAESKSAKTGEKKKLSREAKADGLGLTVNTVDKVYRHEPVNEISLRTAFDTMKILPLFQESYIAFRLPFPRQSAACGDPLYRA